MVSHVACGANRVNGAVLVVVAWGHTAGAYSVLVGLSPFFYWRGNFEKPTCINGMVMRYFVGGTPNTLLLLCCLFVGVDI